MTNPTDTNQASEQFELCKKVYELTGWKQEPDISLLYKYWDNYDELCVISIEEADDTLVPAYASDYLLEKLPSPLIFNENDCAIEVRRTKKDKYMWSANIRHSFGQYFKQIADTPLKALLKLTIALSEAGELK